MIEGIKKKWSIYVCCKKKSRIFVTWLILSHWVNVVGCVSSYFTFTTRLRKPHHHRRNLENSSYYVSIACRWRFLKRFVASNSNISQDFCDLPAAYINATLVQNTDMKGNVTELTLLTLIMLCLRYGIMSKPLGQNFLFFKNWKKNVTWTLY